MRGRTLERGTVLVLACGLIAGQAACVGEKPAEEAPPMAIEAPPARQLLAPDSAELSAAAPDSFDVVFETNKGNFTVRARRAWAPHGVDRFHYLAQYGFYNGARFFRVIPGFMAQFGMSGDPAITAVWQPLRIMDDPVKMGNTPGRVSFAMGGPNTRTTQLFINLVDNTRLDAMGFPAIGEVLEGMDVVGAINGEYGDPPQQMNQQGNITQRGNAYLAEAFTRLDYIKSTKLVHFNLSPG
jgi:peptidyl-prolyl cis-trans isomerase A (cyclophilin A)